jgi:hypothetical protein
MDTKRPDDDQGHHEVLTGPEADLAPLRGGDFNDAEINELRARKGYPPYDPEAPESQIRIAACPPEPRQPKPSVRDVRRRLTTHLFRPPDPGFWDGHVPSEALLDALEKALAREFSWTDDKGRPRRFSFHDDRQLEMLRATGALQFLAHAIQRCSVPNTKDFRDVYGADHKGPSDKQSQFVYDRRPKDFVEIATDGLSATQDEIIEARRRFVSKLAAFLAGKQAAANAADGLEGSDYQNPELDALLRRESDLLAAIEECGAAEPGKRGPLSRLPKRAVIVEALERFAAAVRPYVKAARTSATARRHSLVAALQTIRVADESTDRLQEIERDVWRRQDASGGGGFPQNSATLATAILAAYYRVPRKSVQAALRTS